MATSTEQIFGRRNDWPTALVGVRYVRDRCETLNHRKFAIYVFCNLRKITQWQRWRYREWVYTIVVGAVTIRLLFKCQDNNRFFYGQRARSALDLQQKWLDFSDKPYFMISEQRRENLVAWHGDIINAWGSCGHPLHRIQPPKRTMRRAMEQLWGLTLGTGIRDSECSVQRTSHRSWQLISEPLASQTTIPITSDRLPLTWVRWHSLRILPWKHQVSWLVNDELIKPRSPCVGLRLTHIWLRISVRYKY